ncbi:MAG TPA: hypothetical protein VND96_11845 [Candidatus Micrarchaeaceae archaeon]|nr:hypothetical protein [Candidatus Micrarchaeaceae archaeon]
MNARNALLMTNDMVSMRPLVVFAIKVMGPGPRRVRMVRLAHAMTDGRAAPRPSRPSLRIDAVRQAARVAASRRAA